MGIDWVSVGVGLAGAGIGGICTLLGVKWQLASSHDEQKDREAAHHKAILRALHDELETISEVYKSSVGNQIATLPKGQPFLYFWPVSSEYFAVYHSNSVFIGHLKNNDLRKSLIQTYTYAKALIDSFRLNNAFVEKHQQAVFITAQAPTDANKQFVQVTHQQLVLYGEILQESHRRLEKSAEETLRALRKAGVLSDTL
ncbi:hypothetical protein [Burkholderia cenocepacia]|uniref:hypothetical protein n=1 Tax=Burkholderia cenocepacia TaxID=95486 RepID=UPI0028748503|nr:hypothetical protein [Burkholderia cenocepacia]MDS0850508.1 hypothetical protein [Burkholderia cenocepacia]